MQNNETDTCTVYSSLNQDTKISYDSLSKYDKRQYAQLDDLPN